MVRFRAIRRYVMSGAAVLSLVIVGGPVASAMDTEGGVGLPDAEVGASTDSAAIIQAADAYGADDAEATAALVDVAAASEARPISAVGDEVAVGGEIALEVGATGGLLTAGDGRTFGLSVRAAKAGTVEVVDGVAVAQDALPQTDVVTRAVDGGVQVVAVLADETASTSIVFDLSVPEGAILTAQADGSITVEVPTEVVVFDTADSARFDAQVSNIVGGASSIEDVTDSQWSAIEGLTAPAGTTEIVMETLATVAPAWAVDANGIDIDTTYELNGTTLTQVVHTDENTAFPVIADPSAGFWIKAAQCAGQIVLLSFAVAKAASMAAKLVAYIGGLSKASKVAKAWRTLVGSGSNIEGFKNTCSSRGPLA